MKQRTLILALAIMLAPAAAWADHCASCGVDAPACGCDVVHCNRCAPRCCVCIPPIIPNVLRGVDRVLTGLFSCRPCCPPAAGCVDSCGCGADGFESMGPIHSSPSPASDVMVNPFQDEAIVPQAQYQGQYRRRTQSPYRVGSAAPQRGRVSRAPSRRPTRTTSTQRAPTPAPRDRVAQAIPEIEPAATKPRILKVEYAKPIAESQPAKAKATATLRPAPSRTQSTPTSRYPSNPLR